MKWRTTIAVALSLLLPGVEAWAQERAVLWRRCEVVERVSYERSIASCTVLIELGGESEQRLAMAYYFRADANEQLGKTESAIADYTEALRLNPWFADALRRRGAAYMERKDHDRALADFSAMVRVDPSNSNAYFLRGTVYMARDQYAAAIPEFDEAIRLNPSDWESFEKRAAALEKLGQYESARKDRDHAVNISPGWQTLGCSYAKELEEALSYCNRALQLDPNFHPALVVRANWYRGAGRLEAAIADYDLALKIKPDEAYVYALRGVARLRAGQLDGAITDFDALLERANRQSKEPYIDRRSTALYGRGIARHRKGDIAGGAVDIAAAKAIERGIAEIMAREGVSP
jgi:tetratricopeptide (TPR) repeat protein